MFAGQQYHIISSDLGSMALLVSRYRTLPSRGFFIRALGLSGAELKAHELHPEAHAYCAFVAWLSLCGSDAEMATSLLVNFAAWGANCGRMSGDGRPPRDCPGVRSSGWKKCS